MGRLVRLNTNKTLENRILLMTNFSICIFFPVALRKNFSFRRIKIFYNYQFNEQVIGHGKVPDDALR